MSFVRGSEIISDLVFALYLVWAAYQDCKERLVIRGTHLLGLTAAGIYLLPAVRGLAAALYEGTDGAAGAVNFTVLLSIMSDWYGSENAWGTHAAVWLLVLLCEGIYRRFSLYGLADSFVFLNCALYYWVRYSAFFPFFCSGG